MHDKATDATKSPKSKFASDINSKILSPTRTTTANEGSAGKHLSHDVEEV